MRKTATYRALLRDPRWQKKRLEVLQRDQWRCQQCGATTKELQVHHTQYVWTWNPWEYPLRYLVTLCVTCHRLTTRRGKRRRSIHG